MTRNRNAGAWPLPGAARGWRNPCPGLCLLGVTVVSVSLAEPEPPVRLELSVTPDTVRVDEPFTVRMALELPALEGRFADALPLLPRYPPTLDSPLFDPRPPSGLEGPDVRQWLEAHIGTPGRTPGIAINQYTVRTDPFGGRFGMDPFRRDRRAVFSLPGKTRIIDNARRGWRFEWQFDYRARREGSYPIGPLNFSGPVVTAVDAAGNPRTRHVEVETNVVTLRVLPPPLEGRPDAFVGVTATTLRVAAELDRQISTLGNPLRLTLEITGDFSPDTLAPPRLERWPDLAERFRVHETVETTLLRDGKRFVYRLRPREAGTQELPSIELAYFDSAAGTYRTVRSAPIPLQVHPATELAISMSGMQDDEPDDHQTLELRKTAHLPAAILADSGAVVAFPARRHWAIGPAGFGLVALGAPLARFRRRRRDRRRRTRAVARAQRALRHAKTPIACRTALDAYLTGVRRLPIGALTPGEVCQHLRRQNVAPELADAWRDALERLDAERYRPEGAAPTTGTVTPDAGRLLNLLAQTETMHG